MRVHNNFKSGYLLIKRKVRIRKYSVGHVLAVVVKKKFLIQFKYGPMKNMSNFYSRVYHMKRWLEKG